VRLSVDFFIVTILILFCCNAVPQKVIAPALGPKTTTIELEKYQKIVYVSKNNGSDQHCDGSKTHPWSAIQFALAQLNGASPKERYAILVAEGVYAGETIQMKKHVDLFGGFDPSTWQRDIFQHRTVLSNEDTHRVVIAADSAQIDGFVMTKGRLRGKGAAILCDNVSPLITNNIFVHNTTLAPIPWNPKYRHEIGHDGGAIYCENGAAPTIANNLFVNNSTEVGRGAAIAMQSHCRGSIQNNVFIANQAGLSDPMRSSDGGAVSIFDWSNPVVENNVFLNNKALGENDAGALFVALWSSPIIRNNMFVGNECTDDAGALFVGGQEHRYDRPLDELPNPQQFFISISDNIFIGNSNPTRNSGALRFTMEARGEFRHNLTAHNGGVYFQRCEATISNNLILDNFLLIETKTGLRPCLVKDNLIWGNFDVKTEAKLSNNRILLTKDEHQGIIQDEGLHLIAASSHFDRESHVTTFYMPNRNFRADDLAHRAIKAGERWGVIRSNDRHTISVWGDFSGEVEISILPSYRW
jgi:hypothetical protein